MRAFSSGTVSSGIRGDCSQITLLQPRILPLSHINILMMLTAMVFTLMTPMPAGARSTVPIDALWHIQGVEVASDSPRGLYLATHQGVFFADINGVAARLSWSNDYRGATTIFAAWSETLYPPARSTQGSPHRPASISAS